MTSVMAGMPGGEIAKTVGAVYFTSMHSAKLLRAETIPAGPCVFVSNHWSDGDAFFLCSMLPRQLSEMCIVVNDRVANVAFAGGSPFAWMLEQIELIRVSSPSRRARNKDGAVTTRAAANGDRSTDVIDQVVAAIGRGKSVLLFPQGAIVSPRTPVRRTRVHSGCVTIASRARVPIVPILVVGAHRAWPPGARFPEPGVPVIGIAGNAIPHAMLGDEDHDGELADARKHRIRVLAMEIMLGVYKLKRSVSSSLTSGPRLKSR